MPNPGCQVLTCLPVQVAYICFINIFFPAQTIQMFFFSLFVKLVAKGGEEWCACVHASFLMFMENRQGGFARNIMMREWANVFGAMTSNAEM